jgi:hypothetical protein
VYRNPTFFLLKFTAFEEDVSSKVPEFFSEVAAALLTVHT